MGPVGTNDDDATERALVRLAGWGAATADVRGVIVIGSRARTSDHPADPWSDADIVLATSAPRRYVADGGWVRALGDPWLTYVETAPTGGGQPERRVVLAGGVEVDFAIVSSRLMRLGAWVVAALRAVPGAARVVPRGLAEQLAVMHDIFGRGMRVLVDKDRTAARLQRFLAPPPPRRPPSEREFLDLVERFWHGPIWSAKHIRRGELWRVKTLAEASRHALLLQMVEWHARACVGGDCDTWDRGRFLEEWADPRARAALSDVFGRYDADDTWRALFASMDLFRWLARETAARLGHRYPADLDEHVTTWVTRFHAAR